MVCITMHVEQNHWRDNSVLTKFRVRTFENNVFEGKTLKDFSKKLDSALLQRLAKNCETMSFNNPNCEFHDQTMRLGRTEYISYKADLILLSITIHLHYRQQ